MDGLFFAAAAGWIVTTSTTRLVVGAVLGRQVWIWRILCVCHFVTPLVNEKKITTVADSPEEQALGRKSRGLKEIVLARFAAWQGFPQNVTETRIYFG
jgi:hypothetical protein